MPEEDIQIAYFTRMQQNLSRYSRSTHSRVSLVNLLPKKNISLENTPRSPAGVAHAETLNRANSPYWMMNAADAEIKFHS